MTGEVLNRSAGGLFPFLLVSCDPSAPPTVTFHAAGTAIGPYPGTFEESGTVRFGEQGAGTSNGAALFNLTEADVEFSVDSPVAEVVGTKTLITGTGACVVGPGELGDAHCRARFGSEYASNSFTYIVVAATLNYEATITLSATDESYRDSGTASLDITHWSVSCKRPSEPFVSHGFGVVSVTERFRTSNGVVGEGTASVAVTPATAVNPVDTLHTVTATATIATGGPVEGETIEFTVVGATSEEAGAPVQESCTTDEDGECSVTYQGPTFPGPDAITACADTDDDGVQDAGEPCGQATKEWLLPSSTPGKTTGGGQLGTTATSFSLSFKSEGVEDEIDGRCFLRDHGRDGDQVNCVNVIAYVQTGNEATIYGNATVNGEDEQLFRLHVVDNAESGDPDVLEFETEGGYVRSGVVTRGDIKVHAGE